MAARGRTGVWILGAALLGSVGLNVFLGLRPGSPDGAAARPREVAPRGTPAATGARAHGAGSCAAELAECRAGRLRWSLQALSAPRRSAVPEDSGIREDDAPPPADPSGYEAQREALCGMALRQLRQGWERGRGAITDHLVKDLGDPEKQAKDLQKVVGELAQAMELGPAEERAFAERYAPLRAARIGAALEALRADPPDYAAVLEAATGLFQDEDALIRRQKGEAGLARAREAQLDSRTAVMAILAAFAGEPWDRSIAW